MNVGTERRLATVAMVFLAMALGFVAGRWSIFSPRVSAYSVHRPSGGSFTFWDASEDTSVDFLVNQAWYSDSANAAVLAKMLNEMTGAGAEVVTIDRQRPGNHFVAFEDGDRYLVAGWRPDSAAAEGWQLPLGLYQDAAAGLKLFLDWIADGDGDPYHVQREDYDLPPAGETYKLQNVHNATQFVGASSYAVESPFRQADNDLAYALVEALSAGGKGGKIGGWSLCGIPDTDQYPCSLRLLPTGFLATFAWQNGPYSFPTLFTQQGAYAWRNALKPFSGQDLQPWR